MISSAGLPSEDVKAVASIGEVKIGDQVLKRGNDQ